MKSAQALPDNTNPTPTDGAILVVDDHRQARESMADVLRQSGHHVRCCASAKEALRVLDNETFDCVVTDLKMPGMDGIEFIIQIERREISPQVVMVTAHATVTSAVEAMRHGAFDYIEKPFDADRLEQLVGRAISHGRLLQGTRESTGPAAGPPVMIGSSDAMTQLRRRIEQVAPTPETILITGESGTGKELVAQAIHAASSRPTGPMVSLNCPVLSAQLMESELFGHKRGAFTDANADRVGRFEMAHGGSILLDEVTEIDLNLQAKLLRVLQERSFERVGSSETVRVDVRVIATTNRNLLAEVTAGRFREDLYYRLAVVPIHVPPLRERIEDVPELVDHFLASAAERLGREPCRLDACAYELMTSYPWPGNVRELENIARRISVLSGDEPITADELRRWLITTCPTQPVAATPKGPVAQMEHNEGGVVLHSRVTVPGATPPADHATPIASVASSEENVPVGVSLQEMERRLIEATLEHFGGHRAKTAEALGIGVRTLTSKLRQYGYAPREKSYSRGMNVE